MVSGLATQATSRSALRPRRFPISARVARSGLLNRNLDGSFALRIRFSAARYSFCSRSSWLTEPVTYASSRTHFLFLMPIVYLTLATDSFVFLTIRVEAGPRNPAQFHHALDRQSAIGHHFFLDLLVDRGFPVTACSIRRSSMRCKHPFKKSISSACWPILRSRSAIRPSDQRCFPLPGNTLPGPWRNSRRQRCSTFGFTSKARATSPSDTPCSNRWTAASLNSLVNILLDNPMTQFSFEWILSLNCLCQKWGQVHSVIRLSSISQRSRENMNTTTPLHVPSIIPLRSGLEPEALNTEPAGS